MINKSTFFRSHPDPVVQILLNTELVPEKMIPALAHPEFASNPKVQALLFILLVDAGIKPFEEANQLAESVYMAPCHVDLQIIFLAAWCGVIIGLEKHSPDQIKVIATSMNALVTKDTLPEIKAIVDGVKCLSSSYNYDYAASFKIADSIVDNIPFESFYYKKFTALKALHFLSYGMGSHVKESLEQINPSDFDKVGLTISKLANCALTGQLHEASKLTQEITGINQHKYFKASHSRFQMACSILEILNRFSEKNLIPSLISKEADLNKSWARSTQALLHRKPEEALH